MFKKKEKMIKIMRKQVLQFNNKVIVFLHTRSKRKIMKRETIVIQEIGLSQFVVCNRKHFFLFPRLDKIASSFLKIKPFLFNNLINKTIQILTIIFS